MPQPLNKYSRRITQPKVQGASQAMLYGTAAASCCVEGFSTDQAEGLSMEEVERRHGELLRMITP